MQSGGRTEISQRWLRWLLTNYFTWNTGSSAMFFETLLCEARRRSTMERASVTHGKDFQHTAVLAYHWGNKLQSVVRNLSLLFLLDFFFCLPILSLPSLLSLLQWLHSSDTGVIVWRPDSFAKLPRYSSNCHSHPWLKFCLKINWSVQVYPTQLFTTCFQSYFSPAFLPGSWFVQYSF